MLTMDLISTGSSRTSESCSYFASLNSASGNLSHNVMRNEMFRPCKVSDPFSRQLNLHVSCWAEVSPPPSDLDTAVGSFGLAPVMPQTSRATACSLRSGPSSTHVLLPRNIGSF